jgi:hypothetical protein
MVDYSAADVVHIDMKVGDIRTLESLRQAVVPPYVMIIPFLELPACVELVSQKDFEGEGVHGCVFTLRATAAGEGVLRVGFRDVRTGNVVIEKSIGVKVQ